jgi:membrane protease YdiL (CAAX protease family)
MANNVAPMLVTGTSLLLRVTMALAAPVTRKHAPAPPPPVTPTHDVNPYELLQFGGVFLGLFLVVLSSAPKARRWLLRFCKRALPALRVFDVIAMVAVLATVENILSVTAYAIRPHITVVAGMKTAAEFMIGDAAFLSSIICAVLLARIRARGPHGAIGIWPFWTLIGKERAIWKDIALGAACFPCVMLANSTLTMPITLIVLKGLGKAQDHNPAVDAITPVHGGWPLAVIILTVFMGAALFEELAFRGVLYNVLRRYFGAIAGAVFAALIFAALHGTWTEGPSLFILALVLIWLYERTGRLVASMTLHAVNNGVALLMLFYIAGKN